MLFENDRRSSTIFLIRSYFKLTIVQITLKVRTCTIHVYFSLHRIQHNFRFDEFNICLLWNCLWTHIQGIWNVCSSADHVFILNCWSRVSHFLSERSKYDLHWMEYDGIRYLYILDIQYKRTSSTMAREGTRSPQTHHIAGRLISWGQSGEPLNRVILPLQF